MVKYKDYFLRMQKENQKIFTDFLYIHNLYQANKKANQVIFNEQGTVVRRIIEDWDRRLCQTMEKGSNANYSARLSEKFWGEVRKIYPLIDFVGVTIR